MTTQELIDKLHELTIRESNLIDNQRDLDQASDEWHNQDKVIDRVYRAIKEVELQIYNRVTESKTIKLKSLFEDLYYNTSRDDLETKRIQLKIVKLAK